MSGRGVIRMSHETCQTCMLCVIDGDGQVYRCHLNGPTADKEGFAVWPIVKPGDWCLEWDKH